MNKKSGRPEELVSCADCGRSGECGPSCTCAHRPAAVPPAPPAVFHGGGGWSGEVGGGDDFKYRGVFRSLDIFLLWISRNHAWGAREKGREKFWSCVWPFHEVDISLCVLL